VIGDLDSLRPEVRTFYASRSTPIIHDPDQESTDFGKATSWIQAHPGRLALDTVALGSIGGRVDQGLSQLHHLYLWQKNNPEYTDGRLYLLTPESLVFLLKPGLHRIRVRDAEEDIFDKYVGILPVGGPSVITTRGLEWDVTGWPTEFGGRVSTSNHVRPEINMVEVETTADVLFTISFREVPDGRET